MTLEEYVNIKQLSELIKAYKSLTNEEKSRYSERDVCSKFIMPLISALKWDIFSIDEVREEKSSGGGFVDISLLIFGKSKILIENKKFGSLDGKTQRKGKYITYEEQVFDYAYHLNTDWCILTNFEELRLIFARSKTPQEGKIINLKMEEFLSNDGLQFFKYISKLSVIRGEINSLEGKRKRLPINIKFTKDLLLIYKNIIDSLKRNNHGLNLKDLQEASQRLLDRLLMVRSAEDWNFLAVDHLQKEINHWEETVIEPSIQPFRFNLDNIFKAFHVKYNTMIFEKHKIDTLKIADNILIESIKKLYDYNFDKIGVDVLGSVYEEYLGHILKEKKGKVIIDKDYIIRQKKGIFYTPPTVVKYIISKTINLKPASTNDLKNIAICDISCGSGSFLVEAFSLLENYYKEFIPNLNNTLELFINKTPYSKDILNSLYGIDLDPSSAELASVNLALRAIVKNTKLPNILGENIKIQNSLHSDILSELKFDFIVGNPPYIQGDDLDREEHEMLKTVFPDIYYSEADYCYYFIKKGIDSLKENGKLGYIVAKYFLKAHYGDKLREYILSNCKILEIIDLGNIDVFEGIGSRCCIIILEKCKKIPKDHRIKLMRINERKLKIPKEQIFEQIFLMDNLLEKESYIRLNIIEGFYKKQEELDSSPWLLIPYQISNIYDKCMTMYDSFAESNIQIGRGGITGQTEIFSQESDLIEKYKFEKEIWKDNIKNSDIDRFLLLPLKSKVLFLENINTIQELSNYPITFSYLKQHIGKLAFDRKEFHPPNNILSRDEINFLKMVGKKTIENSPYSYNDENLTIDFEKLINTKCGFKIIDGNLSIDLDSEDFHNFWQWWRWTSPRNFHIFGNKQCILVAPYIAEENKFAICSANTYNDNGDVLGISSNGFSTFDLYYIQGLLNSNLYNFLYSQRAKQKDYRFEYYPIPISELPLPEVDDVSKKGLNFDELIKSIKKLNDLKYLKYRIQVEFDKILLNNNLVSQISFGKIWDNLVKVNLKKVRFNDDDHLLDSVAIRISLLKDQFLIEYFKNEWTDLISIQTANNIGNAYLYYIYLVIDKFIRENQIASRTSWRKGRIFSEILLENIKVPYLDNIELDVYLEIIPNILDELRLNIGENYLMLYDLDNQINMIDFKINQIIYDLFNLDPSERKIIEETIEYNIPYLP